MNLHQIVSPAIAAVNPFITGTLKQATGYTTSGDGTQVPTYATPVTVPLQVQALSGRDIEHLDNMNIQGVVRRIYLNGNVEGVNRKEMKGGDLITFNGQTWLVTIVFETWDADGWCSVGVTLQDD